MIRPTTHEGETRADRHVSGAEKELSILIIDDETNFRQGLRRLLRTIGDDVRPVVYEAPGGEEAVSVLRQQSIGCVLLDYQMQGGDGIAWISRLLEVDEYLPVILITGHGNEETAVAALKNGAMDYLVKGSITPDVLWRTIMNAVEKVRMRQALEEQRKQLIEAERQRAMIESLGAACHHLGQPMTNLTCYLELIKRQNPSAEVRGLIDKCCVDVDKLTAILHQLQRVPTFRTVPYRVEGDERILDIDLPAA